MSTKVICVHSRDKLEIGKIYLMSNIFFDTYGVHEITDLNNQSILFLSDEDYDIYFITLDKWREQQINKVLI